MVRSQDNDPEAPSSLLASDARDVYRRLVAAVGRARYNINARWALMYSTFLSDGIFIHINKTGGSSVEAALGFPFQHRTAVELRAAMGDRRWNSRFRFTFVRNPWDRVVSHYHYRVQTNQTGLAKAQIDFRRWVRLSYQEMDPRWYDEPKMFMPQSQWICDDHGSLLVDFVGRFEHLDVDFQHVCRELGRAGLGLPHRKKSHHTSYERLYDVDTRAIVARAFAADIQLFGYSFGS